MTAERAVRLTVLAAAAAVAAFCVFVTTLGMCADALAGRYPAAVFGVATTAGSCWWVGAALDRWRAAAAVHVAAEPLREQL